MNKIELELTDDELIELSSFATSIVTQRKNDPEIPFVSLCYKLFSEYEKKASYDVKSKVSIAIQAALNVYNNNHELRNKLEDNLSDLVEKSKDEYDKLDQNFEDLLP